MNETIFGIDVHAFGLIFFLGLLFAIPASILVFALRKNKTWLNSVALAGEITFFTFLIFKAQHYPGQIALAITSLLMLLFVFIVQSWFRSMNRMSKPYRILSVCFYLYLIIILVRALLPRSGTTHIHHEFIVMPTKANPRTQRMVDSIKRENDSANEAFKRQREKDVSGK